jgi:hypothetical protein
VLDQRACGEGGAVAADADERARQRRPGPPGEIDDLRDIGEIVAGEGDDVGRPFPQQAVIVGMGLDLQIDEADRMPGMPCGLRHQLEPERLEAEENLGIHQRPRVDEEDPHQVSFRAVSRAIASRWFAVAPDNKHPRLWFRLSIPADAGLVTMCYRMAGGE